MADTASTSVDDRVILESAPVRKLLDQLSGIVGVTDGRVRVEDEAALRERGIDALVRAAVFDENADVRDSARWWHQNG